MKPGSLKRQVAIRFFAAVVITLVLTEGVFFIAVKQFYYSSIYSVLTNHAQLTSSFYTKYSGEVRSRSLASNIVPMLQQFAHPSAELQIARLDGQVLASSTGFLTEEAVFDPSTRKALEQGKPSQWTGTLTSTREHIMAVSIPLLESGQPFAALRYVTSLKEVDRMLLNIYVIAGGIGFVILVFVFMISRSLSSSIVRPIARITEASSQMAQGRFDIVVEEAGPNEVRELASTLNYMASEIRRTERLKHDFISSVSHEIRTPLSGIKGWSETILTGDMSDKEETRVGLNIISKETDRLVNLVEGLLDFSSLYQKRIVLEYGFVQLEPLINEVLVQLGAKADKKHIDLRLHTEASIGEVEADGNRLRQVLLNMIDNAIKYSRLGGRIDVTVGGWENKVFIRVADDGIGIAGEHLTHIGEKFYQADPRKEGTGLGLAICREIMELHGGTLFVESSLGEGTTVTAQLPASKL
jgi:signal transduction histidine kinase